MDTRTPPHLTMTVSERGLAYLPSIVSLYGGERTGQIKVNTSSAASGPCVWITSKEDRPFIGQSAQSDTPTEISLHFRSGDALRFAAQIVAVVGYQLADGTAEWLKAVVDAQDAIAALTAKVDEDEET